MYAGIPVYPATDHFCRASKICKSQLAIPNRIAESHELQNLQTTELTVSVLLRQVSDQVVAIGIFCLALRESGAWNSWARAPHDSRPSFRTWCPFKGYQLIFSGYAKFRQTRLWIRGPIAIKQVFFGRWRWTSICWRFCWWWTPGAPWWKTHPHVAPEHMKYGNFMRLGRQTWTIVGVKFFWGQINSSQNSIKFYEGKSYRIFQCLELSDHGENCNTSQIHRCPWTQLRSFLLFCMPPWNRHKKQETVVPKMLQMPATKKLPPRICWASWMLRTMPGDGKNIPEELRNSKNISKAREWVELRPWPPSWSSEKKQSIVNGFFVVNPMNTIRIHILYI